MAALPKHRWVQWAVAYLLLCQIDALSVIDRILYGDWADKPGDKLTQTINILQIAVGIVLFYRGLPIFRSFWRGGVISVSLATLMLCSTAWSISPWSKPTGGRSVLLSYRWRDWRG